MSISDKLDSVCKVLSKQSINNGLLSRKTYQNKKNISVNTDWLYTPNRCKKVKMVKESNLNSVKEQSVDLDSKELWIYSYENTDISINCNIYRY